jgi:hypothetical protein
MFMTNFHIAGNGTTGKGMAWALQRAKLMGSANFKVFFSFLNWYFHVRGREQEKKSRNA